MGMFKRLFGKRQDATPEEDLVSSAELENFERNLIQTLVMTMLSVKIVTSPEMNFLRSGNSLRDNYLYSLLNDRGVRRMFPKDFKQYLIVIAYHSLGAGAYIAVKDAEGCNIENQHSASAQTISEDLLRYGSLELGLKAIWTEPESNNKKVYDHLVVSSINWVYDKYEEELQYLNKYKIAMLQVFFNVGVTIALRRLTIAQQLTNEL